MDLGARIAAWRNVTGLSRQELAEAVGVTAAAAYHWEDTGESKTMPSAENLERIAAAFGVTLEQFFGPVPSRRPARVTAPRPRKARAS